MALGCLASVPGRALRSEWRRWGGEGLQSPLKLALEGLKCIWSQRAFCTQGDLMQNHIIPVTLSAKSGYRQSPPSMLFLSP